MRQLGELQKHAEEFEKLNAELIFIFREEEKGIDGLKEIRDRHKTRFTLALDPEKKSTQRYSNGRMEFDNYVVRDDGTIVGIVDGTLRERATAEQLLKILRDLQQ
ncbi:MAG: hypothetical protein D6753_12120 [Planctomycetota bacterium]|nr:MAG: hypothetical protein D6753_12120 [Planctomycetota bacterium]